MNEATEWKAIMTLEHLLASAYRSHQGRDIGDCASIRQQAELAAMKLCQCTTVGRPIYAAELLSALQMPHLALRQLQRHSSTKDLLSIGDPNAALKVHLLDKSSSLHSSTS
jgi:hypothetical protein